MNMKNNFSIVWGNLSPLQLNFFVSLYSKVILARYGG